MNNPLKFTDPTGNFPDDWIYESIFRNSAGKLAAVAESLTSQISDPVACTPTFAPAPVGAEALNSQASGTGAYSGNDGIPFEEYSFFHMAMNYIGELEDSQVSILDRNVLPPYYIPDASDIYGLPESKHKAQKIDPNVIYNFKGALKWYKSKKGGEAILGDNITESIKLSPYFQWFLVKDIENTVPSRSDLEKGIGAHRSFWSNRVYTFSPNLNVMLGVGTIDEVRVRIHSAINGEFIEYTAQIEVSDTYNFEGNNNSVIRFIDKKLSGNFISYDPNANFRTKGTFEINGRIPKK